MNHIEIADRLYSYHGDIASELSFDKSKTYLCPLDYLNCVSLIGDNAKNFLQGQLSCDVNLVDENHYLTGLLCSLKGRIIAMMDVIHCHDYQLVIEKDITERTLSSLKNVAKLSQVQMKPSNTYRALGIINNSNHIDLPISPPENNNIYTKIKWPVYTKLVIT